ncbi:MAG: helix-turn-helix domain-containing protein, partial [Chloroflexi bacterium]|nr:helix-turn-helix domain-containing protein [Chloroflexota bacterium]
MPSTDRPGPFAILLHRYRVTAGVSQEELAERAGLSRRGISDLERGERRSPHPSTVRRLAEALTLGAVERATLLRSASAAAADGSSGPSLPSVPVLSSSFVGRARELAEVRRLLTSTRLLTLTGAGGSGKTRLALEAAIPGSQDDFPDGVALVLLAPLADPELVAPSIAQMLTLRERANLPLRDALVAYLRP